MDDPQQPKNARPPPSSDSGGAGVAVVMALGALVGFRWLLGRTERREPSVFETMRALEEAEERELSARRVLEDLAARSPALAREIHARLRRHELGEMHDAYRTIFAPHDEPDPWKVP